MKKEELDKVTETIIGALKLSGKNVGLLINFNVMQLTQGIKRRVNEIEGQTFSLRSPRSLR